MVHYLSTNDIKVSRPDWPCGQNFSLTVNLDHLALFNITRTIDVTSAVTTYQSRLSALLVVTFKLCLKT